LNCSCWRVFQIMQKVWAAWGNLACFSILRKRKWAFSRILKKCCPWCLKKNCQFENYMMPIKFWAYNKGWIFLFLFKNLGTWQILCLERFRTIFFKMLGNISGDVGNFGLRRKVIKFEFVSFLPKTFWVL